MILNVEQESVRLNPKVMDYGKHLKYNHPDSHNVIKYKHQLEKT